MPFTALLRIVALSTAILLTCGNTTGAEITLNGQLSKGGWARVVDITGEITKGDDVIFAKLLLGAKQAWVTLDSFGGDVDTALSLGTIIRSYDGVVRTGSCFSACALILAGGVIRVGPTWFDDPVIGVHRIYFAELESGLSSSEVKSRYDAQLARVRKYLAQMNVAPEFLSFMQAVGPENSHVMTHEELTRYGLGPKDVVYDERMTADRAAEFGINSLEYRRRERRGTEECKGISSGMPEPTDAELLEARRSHVSIDILRQAQCSLAIHYGISVSLYLERSAQVTARCSRYTEKTQQNRCHAHFMTSGKAIP